MKNKHYADSFGVEWKSYPDVHLDSINMYEWNISKSRLELVLGFPCDFLKGKSVIELGGGPGRFSEVLSQYAKKVHVIDASDAIEVNIVKNKKNVTTEKNDFLMSSCIKKHANKFDIVFCRGVIQHTENPKKAIQDLFKYGKKNSLVIFDVYPRRKPMWLYKITNFKYFWRMILPKIVSVETFDRFLKNHLKLVYRIYQTSRFIRSNILIKIICRIIPFIDVLFVHDLLKDHPGITNENDKARLVASLLIDGIYAFYDKPMTVKEINSTLAEIGEKYYSVDRERCIFRCVGSKNNKPKQYIESKNGIFLF